MGSSGWGCATWESFCPAWLQLSIFPFLPCHSQLVESFPRLLAYVRQVSRHRSLKFFQPSGMKQCGADCINQRCVFPSQLWSQVSHALTSGSRWLLTVITDTAGHHHLTPNSQLGPAEAKQKASHTSKHFLPVSAWGDPPVSLSRAAEPESHQCKATWGVLTCRTSVNKPHSSLYRSTNSKWTSKGFNLV